MYISILKIIHVQNTLRSYSALFLHLAVTLQQSFCPILILDMRFLTKAGIVDCPRNDPNALEYEFKGVYDNFRSQHMLH